MAPLTSAAEGAAILAQRCDQPRQHGDGWQACCPAHEDRTPSLSITPQGDRILLHCHAGCAPAAIVAALGLQMRDLFVSPPPLPPAWPSRPARPQTPPAAPPAGATPAPPPLGPPQLTALYDYVDASGQLLFQVLRFEPGFDGRPKDFRQRRPTGRGGWIKNLQGVTRVLYHLPEVRAAVAAGQTIYLPEGEKDADRLRALGLIATTNAGGAAKWAPQYSETLRGAHVVLLQDNDVAGHRHTARLTRALAGLATSLKVLTFPELPTHGDVSDWLAAGGTRAELEARVAATPLWQPNAAPVAEERATEPPAEVVLPYSDYTNAVALVRAHGQELRYCYPWKSWLVWTGTHWARDRSGGVMRYAKQTIKRLARRAEDLDDERAKAVLKHVKESLATAKLKAMVESAQSEPDMPVQPEHFDTHPWLLNCTNGTLDLQTGTLRPHQPADLLTKCLPLAYDPAATCPTWEAFVWHLMGGTTTPDAPDLSAGALEARHAADARAQRLITFLQRTLGYALTGVTREQCLFVLHGSGSNGKSTFLEVVQTLLGDYAQSTPAASLLAKPRHEGIPNDIARLRGARLVTAVEIGEGKHLNEELVKRLTGQDTLTARFLHAEFFDFTATFKLLIACNHLPTIRGTDHAIWRRIKLIPFTVTIPDAAQDKTLSAQLRQELPGLLRWAVQGCLDWQRHGLGTPAEVLAATAEYRATQDVIGRFIDECCVVHPQVRVKANDLYDAYKKWCDASGEQPVTLTAFGKRLEYQGFTRHKVGIVWRLGLGLQAVTAS